MCFFDDLFQLLQALRLMENPGLDLVGPAPVGHRVEVLRQGSEAEELGFLVLGVLREGKRIVGRRAAEEDEGGVAHVLPQFRR